jgi:hypothetical protein
MLDVVGKTAATLPNARETVVLALEDPAIKGAIHRGARKAQVNKYASVTRYGRGGACEHTSDFEQATYLALLGDYCDQYAALTPEERPTFVEKLAMSIAWHEVYPMKREVPPAEPRESDEVGSHRSRVLACDDISLNGRKRYPNWISARALESEFIECIDRQRAETPAQEQPETKYERMCRILGPQKADWMLDYENHRYESAKTTAERVCYCRLRKKIARM